MSYPAYPEYKDSGAEWLGEVPVHWEVTKLSYITNRIGSGKTPSGGATAYVSSGVPFIRSQNVHDQGLRLGDIVYIDEATDREMAWSRVRPLDVLINITGASIGRSCQVPVGFGRANVNQHVCVIRLEKSEETSGWVAWFMKAPSTKEQVKVGQTGAAREGLNFEQLASFCLCMPPINERKTIAAFLDHETARIDALVEEQQRLIALLKEKRQAVISHAVTKGLNPDAPMKDSGVEWLGEVPEHWIVAPIKMFVSFLDGKRIPLKSEDRGSRQGEFSYYGASGVIDWIDDYIFDRDHVLVSEDGANLIARSTPIAFVARGKYWVNNHAHILEPIDENLFYWAELIEVLDLSIHVTGSAQPKLTSEALGSISITSPPSCEERFEIQKKITEVDQVAKDLINEAQNGIKLLQERRSAIISAAVTGKIDVRGWKPPAESVVSTKAKQMEAV
ncbi:restriction endonuclease subunit S [Vreelandella sulfidaeris]